VRGARRVYDIVAASVHSGILRRSPGTDVTRPRQPLIGCNRPGLRQQGWMAFQPSSRVSRRRGEPELHAGECAKDACAGAAACGYVCPAVRGRRVPVCPARALHPRDAVCARNSLIVEGAQRPKPTVQPPRPTPSRRGTTVPRLLCVRVSRSRGAPDGVEVSVCYTVEGLPEDGACCEQSG
jgi:hypothetical protein